MALRYGRGSSIGAVWSFSCSFFLLSFSFYGVAFWLPQVIKSFSGLGNSAVAVLSAVPYLAASICMVIVAKHSDKTGERRWHVALSAFTAALGLLAGVYFLK